jgi:RNA-directed DNA polymerase
MKRIESILAGEKLPHQSFSPLCWCASMACSVKTQLGRMWCSRRSRGVSFGQVVEDLSTFLRGWIGYYRLVETHRVIRDLDSWIRRRLRCFMVKCWINNCHTRYKKLVAMGVNRRDALAMAASRKGPWGLSNAKPLKVAMPNQFFADQGLLSLLHQYEVLGKVT